MSTHHAGEHAGQTDCAAVVLRLFEYVDNEAGKEDAAQIKAHLDDCGSCLREYERDLLLKALVRRACEKESAPAALRTRIMTRITTSVTVIHTEQL
ncbi:mycothiol system anti-sigma-R factor [Ornithinimicrobium sp. INDO-MA30-4]|uniref:mycothiol system anti-sigma-R factor n=1 Tax=Ornithinimicrobium sp. INDO-MA30-4 TaxID=2908651 RepID=UPI001F2E60CD|nr:mycothiol system anti-sigma-R factor [Ornithinimicrobium sp. INDO-MA30-4]UJH71521.1 mycothiol system anti-sigma-R factor [Ornithinimicrobium sp. INDO-MA30-4]